MKLDDRQVIRIIRVRKATDFGLPTQCGESDLAMIQVAPQLSIRSRASGSIWGRCRSRLA